MDLQHYIPGDVYNRSDYGAPSTPGGARRDRSRVVGMTLHWTTGNVLGEASTLAWVGNIYRYHVNTRGWADIGYAYLFDRYGNVYVGRGRYRALAHATGYNTTWLGCAFLGGHNDHVTDEAKQAAAGLRRWLRNEGGMINMSRVNGHRDLGSTACPGTLLHSWVHSGMRAPELPQPEPEQTKGYNMLIYAYRDSADSLSAYNVMSQHNTFSVLTHSRGEAVEAMERGDDVVAVGGPAARDLRSGAGGGVNQYSNVTTIIGSDRAETLSLFSEWAQDNL